MLNVYRFSQQSLSNLHGVHPDLVACVVLCLHRYATTDFGVIEGVRTTQRQRALVEQGKSGTLASKHLIQTDGFAHAVDLAPWVAGSIPWDRWAPFADLARAMIYASRMLGVQIVWGGDWEERDGPHFELAEVAGG